MSVPASSKVSSIGRNLAGILRRNDMLPWLTGISLFLAISVGAWVILSGGAAGLPGLILLVGIALLGFIAFYGLATGAIGRSPAETESFARRSSFNRVSDIGVLARVLDSAPEAYLVTTRQGAVLYANTAYEKLTRAGNRGRNMGRPLPLEQVFAGDEDLAAPLYRLARAARHGRRGFETLPLKTADEGTRTLLATVNRLEGDTEHVVWRISEQPATEQVLKGLLLDETGQQLGQALDSHDDQAELKDGTEAARGASQKQRDKVEVPLPLLIDRAPIAIAMLAFDGTIERSNEALGALANRPVSQGMKLIDLLNEEDRQAVTSRLHSVSNGEEIATPLEVQMVEDGRNAQLHLGRVSDASENQDGSVVAYLVDLTEQKSLEMQFSQSQKLQAVGQLAGGVAHDFNNLLTAIIGFCDLLLTRHHVGDPSFGDIDQIRQNANRAANLVRQLLAFSRQQTLTPRVFSPTDVLTELSMLLRRLLGETVELELTHGRNLGLIKVDQSQIDTALINLAVNARDAMPDGGKLTIRSRNIIQPESRDFINELIPPGDYVLIEVSDTGTGIEPDNLSKIFEPFFTTKGVGEGTGLGLSTVYGIIKQMGGFIFPDSEMGKGTTFSIYLPTYQETEEDRQAAAKQSSTVEPARDLTGVGTILLVEDEDAVRAFATRALSSRGFTVLEASNGVEAIKVIEAQDKPIDLVVTDVVMPEMDGPTLAKKVREMCPNTKIIFISGYAEHTFKNTLGRPEDVSFLPKPFSLKQLAAKVKEVLSE